MKKIIVTAIIFFILFDTASIAQSKEAMQKIESARIALITQRLDLTPEQAQKFWPIYNEYTDKRQQMRQEYAEARRGVNKENITDEKSKELIEQGFKMKEQQLELEKEYARKLNQVITHTQLLQLRKAEDDFRKMILERLEHRREKRDRMRDRQQRGKNN